MKAKLSFVVIFLFIAMAGVNLFLVVQNVSYGKENRELILQNDSILSVNLDLTNELNRLNRMPLVREGRVHGPRRVKKK